MGTPSRAEMQPEPSTRTVNSSRNIDVSLNSAAPRAPSNMVISDAPDLADRHGNQLAVVRFAVPSRPEQAGSFAPPSVSIAANLPPARVEDVDLVLRLFGCENCGGDHPSAVCQERDPWEYVAPFFGSTDFGQGFYSIPIPETNLHPVEQLNYAHITVEQGDITSRDFEHEFNVWADSMHINWKFFAKVVSPTVFRTRFPNAKSIDELAHFGKLFMKTVPSAVISLQKWAGDIEPISWMQEAWFRVKGIPMKYRNKSTAYYGASTVGKPLALDKNYLRIFYYICVKIGCQDIELVSNTRIGEIKKGFYEFQFTRDVPEEAPFNGNNIGVEVNAQTEGEQQSTPKR
jgi:hypothetical protein